VVCFDCPWPGVVVLLLCGFLVDYLDSLSRIRGDQIVVAETATAIDDRPSFRLVLIYSSLTSRACFTASKRLSPKNLSTDKT